MTDINSYSRSLSQYQQDPNKALNAITGNREDFVVNHEDHDHITESGIIIPNKYNFCHLHRHCEASIQDGVGKVEDGVKYAKEMGHPAIGVTDHGNLISYVRFYNEALNQGIKHVFGLEAYITESIQDRNRQYNHCTIFVKNEQGFKNILKLNHIAQTQGFYYKPRIDWDTLLRHKEGLIVLSGCVVGKTCQLILGKKYDEAEAWTRMMKKEMGDDYYMELMLSDFHQQGECNQFLLELSEKYKVPGVITGDAHYVKKEDYQAQKAMMLLSSKATVSQLEEQQRKKAAAIARGELETQEEKDKIWIFESDQYWMKNEQEQKEAWEKWHSSYYPFEKFEQHMNESGKIADKVEIVHLDTSYKMPKADLVDGEDHEVAFERMLLDGLIEKGLDTNAEYVDRLKMEVEIIKKKGLIDYFLVTHDVISWAKRNDVFVGPGRGSSGGSLVCYLLDIVEIDPIEHDLLFERFLDLGREEMPDIDTDFEIDRRDDIKEYIKQRYGEDHVASICALGTFRARNIVRDIARVYDHEAQDINEISKLIPEDAVFIDDELQVGGEEYHQPTLDKFFADNPQIRTIASTLFGQIRHISKHAAGVIITDRPLDECIATIHVGDNIMTAWTEGIYRKELSQLNVLKLDILGLKTLSIIKKACALAGIDYRNLTKIDMNEKVVYDVINKGRLIKGIFQFDSNTGAWLFNHMKPENFGDLVALGALDRPGPLDSGMAFEYIERKDNPQVSYFDHPAIESVLGETRGVIVYQEQLMNLAKKLCGFDPVEASALRKNLVKIQLSKEAQKKVLKQRVILKKKFVDGAVANGAKQETAEMLWEAMTKFARYGFNKAHSVGYAYITYWTMWLKFHYPLEFYSALLSYTSFGGSNESKSPDMREILDEMRKMGLDIDAPDINKSQVDFHPDHDRRKVLYGLNKIKYLGKNAQDAILENRPFTSFEDLSNKIAKSTLNKRAKEALIRCGAFRESNPDKGSLLRDLEQQSAKKNEIIQYKPYTEADEVEDLKSYLGMNLRDDTPIRKRSAAVSGQYKHWKNEQMLRDMPEVVERMEKNSGESVDQNGIVYEMFSGFVLGVRQRTSKSGYDMVELELGVWKDRPIKFFIMNWDLMYNSVTKLKANQCISVAILKRKNKKDFPKLTHIKELT